MSGTAIPLERDADDPTSPNYMMFDDQPPVRAAVLAQPTCHGIGAW